MGFGAVEVVRQLRRFIDPKLLNNVPRAIMMGCPPKKLSLTRLRLHKLSVSKILSKFQIPIVGELAVLRVGVEKDSEGLKKRKAFWVR